MGNNKQFKVKKIKNKESVPSLLENDSLKGDCLKDAELYPNQEVSVDVKDGHEERNNKRSIEVNDVDEGSLKGKRKERRSKDSKEKEISPGAVIGEHSLEQKDSGDNQVGNRKNKRKEKYGEGKEDGADIKWDGGVIYEMDGGMEKHRKVKKSKRKREKISGDVADEAVNDETERHSPSGEKESKVKKKILTGDLFAGNGGIVSNGKVKKNKRKREKMRDGVVDKDVSDGTGKCSAAVEKESKFKKKSRGSDLCSGNEDESNGTRCKESKRIGGIKSIISEINMQFSDTNRVENGKKMKTKKIPTGSELGSEGRDGYDTMGTGLGTEASDGCPYLTSEGQSIQNVANSEIHETGKIKKKKKNKIKMAEEGADNHFLEGKECNEEHSNEKDVESIEQSSNFTVKGKTTQGVGSSEVDENGKKTKSKKSKMRKGKEHVSEGKECNEVSENGKVVEAGAHSSQPKSKKKSKRVSFSDEVEALELVRGKRFTKEEDEKVIDSVHFYIESHGLGNEGLKMILKCGSYPEVRNCWKEIGAALPHRPCESVYYRAHILFERAEERKWKPEERELILRFHEKHGPDWKTLGEALGKHRFHVKDAWRRFRFGRRGNWSQEEYQNLFDLVNQDLCMRALDENRKSKHGMLRDNIPWGSISETMRTRDVTSCCFKWYDQLTSPMVIEGSWSDSDDYRLVSALYELDACSMEEVEWDFLLENRAGDVCRKRWNQMVRHVGEHGNKSFAEQVELLSKRYCPHLVEAREAFDSKPVVD